MAGRDTAATSRWPVSVARRLRCWSSKAALLCPPRAQETRARTLSTARRCSGSAKLRPAIASATGWTRPIRRRRGPASRGWKSAWPSRPRGRPLQDLSGRTLIARDGTEYSGAQRRGCPHCRARQRANRKSERYPAMLAATAVAPGHSGGVPRAVYRARTAQANQDSDVQARQPLVSPTSRTAPALASRLSRRRSVRGSADRHDGQTTATLFASPPGKLAQGAGRLQQGREARAPRLRAARKNVAAATSPRHCASAGSRPCRGAPTGAST